MVSELFIQDTILGLMKNKLFATYYRKLTGFCSMAGLTAIETDLTGRISPGAITVVVINIGCHKSDNYLYTRSAIL